MAASRAGPDAGSGRVARGGRSDRPHQPQMGEEHAMSTPRATTAAKQQNQAALPCTTPVSSALGD